MPHLESSQFLRIDLSEEDSGPIIELMIWKEINDAVKKQTQAKNTMHADFLNKIALWLLLIERLECSALISKVRFYSRSAVFDDLLLFQATSFSA